MGDLDCDISKSPPESNTWKLQFLSLLYQLDQLISEPTRVLIDEKLSWDLHVEKTCKKVGVALLLGNELSHLFLIVFCK